MITHLLIATLLQVTSDPRLLDQVDFSTSPDVYVQPECQVWVDPEYGNQTSYEDDLEDWSVLCLETPMSNLDVLGEILENGLNSRGWHVVDSIGYSEIYSHNDTHHCPTSLAVSFMTKDAPEDPDIRSSAETAVLVLMTPKEDLDTCS